MMLLRRKKKKKREKKIISSDKRSNSSREREALMHCNMLPGTTMHGFGCLHSRKKKIKQRGAEKCCITIWQEKRAYHTGLRRVCWVLLAKQKPDIDRITAYKCTEVLKPRKRKQFSWKGNTDTHRQKPRNKYTLEIKKRLLFTYAFCYGQNPVCF